MSFVSELETSNRSTSLAWIHTASSSPLHTFLVDLYARCVHEGKCFDQDNEQRGYFDIDFLMRVMVALDALVKDPKGVMKRLQGSLERSVLVAR